MAIEVDRDENLVLQVRGDKDDPFSRGYICPKAVALKDLHEDPDRLRRPLRKTESGWQEVSWDEAIDFAVEGIRRVQETHGKGALATYMGNPNAHDLGAGLYVPALTRAAGTRSRYSASSVDQWPKQFSSMNLYGSPNILPVPDVDRTDFFLALGANPLASNGSLMTAPDMRGRLRDLQGRGGELVVVDPRRSETARVADQHISIRPGRDAYFLFAMIHTLFEEDLVDLGDFAEQTNGLDELRALAMAFPPARVAQTTGVAAEVIVDLTRRFASAERAICYGRIGTCTQEFGSLASWLVDCVCILTGNLDRPGGILFPRGATSPSLDKPRGVGRVRYDRWRSRVSGLPEFLGELPVATMAEDMDTPGEGQLRGLLTVAGNPVLSTPNGARLDAALGELEFMVSVDIYLNETTRHADVILPAESPLERPNHEMGFDAFKVRRTAKAGPAVFPLPEGARPQWWILAELAGRLGGGDAEAVDTELFEGLLASKVGRPGAACPDVSVEEARVILGGTPGPERLYDLILRSGPNGDRLEKEGEGLSLERVLESKHGIDLGPHEPRLEKILATESGRIELAQPLLVEDIRRLEARLDDSEDSLLLVGRRHVRSNNSWMHNMPTLVKGPERCTLLIHPEDAARFGLEDGEFARVTSRVGSIEVPVSVSDEMMRGVVSVPHGYGHVYSDARVRVASRHAGASANDLVDEADVDARSGNAVLNGVPVSVTPAETPAAAR